MLRTVQNIHKISIKTTEGHKLNNILSHPFLQVLYVRPRKKVKILWLLVTDFFETCQALNANLLALAAKNLKYNMPPPAAWLKFYFLTSHCLVRSLDIDST